MNQPNRQVDSGQRLVSSVHAEISAAARRTASSWSRARFAQAAATFGTPSGPTSASCTPVCSQSAWLSSASATARAMSLTAATVPTRASASAVCRVTAVSSTSSSSPTSASAASGTSVKEARSRPARTRCGHEGDDASAKAASNPLIISGTTRQSHAPEEDRTPAGAAHTLDEEHRGTPPGKSGPLLRRQITADRPVQRRQRRCVCGRRLPGSTQDQSAVDRPHVPLPQRQRSTDLGRDREPCIDPGACAVPARAGARAVRTRRPTVVSPACPSGRRAR
ncbi:hypothetical protein B0E37_01537 [Streptomyces sp. MH192]|nr:hypothetical protein [Streptomyces sp. MH192]MCF0098101.1 hypothetical protein [Streptomyces sp. MH191]